MNLSKTSTLTTPSKRSNHQNNDRNDVSCRLNNGCDFPYMTPTANKMAPQSSPPPFYRKRKSACQDFPVQNILFRSDLFLPKFDEHIGEENTMRPFIIYPVKRLSRRSALENKQKESFRSRISLINQDQLLSNFETNRESREVSKSLPSFEKKYNGNSKHLNIDSLPEPKKIKRNISPPSA